MNTAFLLIALAVRPRPDRTRETAEAAKGWGQNDYITVTRIRQTASSDVRRKA